MFCRRPLKAQFNYIADIGAKWYRNYFYFFSIYICPGPNALFPTFESKFARMEPLGGGKFALYFMRHSGEWVGIYDSLSVDECMKAIQDDAGSSGERLAGLEQLSYMSKLLVRPEGYEGSVEPHLPKVQNAIAKSLTRRRRASPTTR